MNSKFFPETETMAKSIEDWGLKILNMTWADAVGELQLSSMLADSRWINNCLERLFFMSTGW